MLFHLFYRLTIQNLHHKYSCTPASADSVSTVSVISGLPRPPHSPPKLTNKQKRGGGVRGIKEINGSYVPKCMPSKNRP